MISVKINGKEQSLDGPVALLGYLESLGVDMKHIAVAHNGSVLPREKFREITISEGDEIEIVRAVGGGA